MGLLGSLKKTLTGGGGVEEGGGQGQDSPFSNKDLANYEPDPNILLKNRKNFIPDVPKGSSSQGVNIEPQPYNPSTLEERQRAAVAARDTSVKPTWNEGNGTVQQPPNSNGRSRF
jgi:hypothetical protein